MVARLQNRTKDLMERHVRIKTLSFFAYELNETVKGNMLSLSASVTKSDLYTAEFSRNR